MLDNPFFVYGAGKTYLALALMALAVFGFSMGVEIWRRLRSDRRMLEEQWEGVETILRDKDLSSQQKEMVRALFKRCASRHPYRAATQRDIFDECVSKEMKRHAGKSVDVLDEQGEQWRNIRVLLGLDFVPSGQNITHTRDLYFDQRLWFAGSVGGESAQWHAGRVTRLNEAHFLLTPEESTVTPPRAGTLLPIRLWRDDDARYGFESEVVRTDNQPAGWLLRHAENLERTQSRSHFRIRHDQTAEIHVLEGTVNELPAPGTLERPEVARFLAHIVNLSGGGFAVTTTQPLPGQVLLRTMIKLDDGREVPVLGKIVNSQALHGGRYLVRCAFTGMPDAGREAIAQFVLRRQTQLTAAPA